MASPSTEVRSSVCVVRLKTTAWSSNRGLHVKQDITYLKRKSFGHNILEEEIECTCPDDAFRSIVNLHECADGIYEIIVCNVSTDWETGYVDSYDLKLIPYKEET